MESMENNRDCEGNADGAVSPFWIDEKGTRESIFTRRIPPRGEDETPYITHI
jgi:hypothetical protein